MDAQLKKGVLDLCVLSQLKKKDMYGYELTEMISAELQITAGTLYLVLKRLKDNGHVETYLVESSSGPARKYYHITEKGEQYRINGKQEFTDFVERTMRLL